MKKNWIKRLAITAIIINVFIIGILGYDLYADYKEEMLEVKTSEGIELFPLSEITGMRAENQIENYGVWWVVLHRGLYRVTTIEYKSEEDAMKAYEYYKQLRYGEDEIFSYSNQGE